MSSYQYQTILRRVRALHASQPFFLDTETTGLGPDAEIVEIAILNYAGEALVETLVRPRRPIPADVVRIHGIRDEMVRSAPTWSEVWPQVRSTLGDRPVGVYNAEFDLRMLQQSNKVNGLPWEPLSVSFFCIMKMYTALVGYGRYQSLDAAGKQIGARLANAHRAREDTLLAREVFLHMVQLAGEG